MATVAASEQSTTTTTSFQLRAAAQTFIPFSLRSEEEHVEQQTSQPISSQPPPPSWTLFHPNVVKIRSRGHSRPPPRPQQQPQQQRRRRRQRQRCHHDPIPPSSQPTLPPPPRHHHATYYRRKSSRVSTTNDITRTGRNSNRRPRTTRPIRSLDDHNDPYDDDQKDNEAAVDPCTTREEEEEEQPPQPPPTNDDCRQESPTTRRMRIDGDCWKRPLNIIIVAATRSDGSHHHHAPQNTGVIDSVVSSTTRSVLPHSAFSSCTTTTLLLSKLEAATPNRRRRRRRRPRVSPSRLRQPWMMAAEPRSSTHQYGSDDTTHHDHAVVDVIPSASRKDRTCSSSSSSSSSEEEEDDDDDPAARITRQGSSEEVIQSSVVRTTTNRNRNRNKRMDMTRLRDRWWDALKKQPLNGDPNHSLSIQAEQELKRHASLEGATSEFDIEHATETPFPTVVDETAPLLASCTLLPNILATETNPMPLEPIYTQVTNPVQEAIRRNDATALRELLRRMPTSTTTTTTDHSCRNSSSSMDELLCNSIEWAVELNRPQLLRILLNATTSTNQDTSSHRHKQRYTKSWSSDHNNTQDDSSRRKRSSSPPLLLAALRGHDECLQLLLAADSAALLHTKDTEDNNVLHVCCQSTLPTAAATLRIVLDCGCGSSSHRASAHSHRLIRSILLPKLAQTKNCQGQTPLHVACWNGRSVLVDTLLESLPTGIVNKLLWSAVDDTGRTPLLSAIESGSTRVVTSLLMWRGNNHHHHHQENREGTRLVGANASAIIPCPLSYAVEQGNEDMVQLLLDFHDPNHKTREYSLDDALRVAVTTKPGDNSTSNDDDNNNDASRGVDNGVEHSIIIRLNLIRILVRNGANPCAVEKSNARRPAEKGVMSALALAATHGDATRLHVLLDAYASFLACYRRDRRRNPMLQKLPESYFSGIESQEERMLSSALCDALIHGLFSAYRATATGSQCSLSQFYRSCDMLYQKGAQLNTSGIFRLQSSLVNGVLLPIDVHPSCSYVCFYRATGSPLRSERRESHSRDADHLRVDEDYWSRVFTTMDWAGEACDCLGLKSYVNDKEFVHREADVVVLSNEGSRFMSHSEILISKSEKLAASIRFAFMTRTNKNAQELIEIKVDAADNVVVYMLQHIYHGSLLVQESYVEANPSLFINEILSLLLLADEFLCPSLMRECELRLLSSEPWQCFCPNCIKATKTLPVASSESQVSFMTYELRGPSYLLQRHVASVVDIFAVTDHITHVEDSQEPQYVIHWLWTEDVLHLELPVPDDYSSFLNSSALPLVLLRFTAAASLLQNWVFVRNCPEIQSEFGDGGWETLLETSLNILASCLISPMLPTKNVHRVQNRAYALKENQCPYPLQI